MVVCSCNVVSTSKIKEVIETISEPTVKKVVFALGWKSQCALCSENLVNEIRNILSERDNEL